MIPDKQSPEFPRPRLVCMLDKLVMAIAEISSWIFLLIGLIVTYEVIARYIFNAPTHWVEETSRLGLVWATFLLLPACLRRRQLITITLLAHAASLRMRGILEGITFLLIAGLALTIAWYGYESMMQTIAINRRTNTTLSVPYWAFYLPITVGFLLFFVQAIAEFAVLIIHGPRQVEEYGPEDI